VSVAVGVGVAVSVVVSVAVAVAVAVAVCPCVYVWWVSRVVHRCMYGRPFHVCIGMCVYIYIHAHMSF